MEHYSNLDDLKRVMSRTELIQPEFLVKFFGTQSCETSMECLHHLLRTNMRQNLQLVVQVAREYSEQLTSEKLIEMFEQYNSWEGLFCARRAAPHAARAHRRPAPHASPPGAARLPARVA